MYLREGQWKRIDEITKLEKWPKADVIRLIVDLGLKAYEASASGGTPKK